MKIRIRSIPPGFAPREIRKEWVGVEIPLATKEELAVDPPSGIGIGRANDGGYYVLRDAAIHALMRNGKDKAAGFWEGLPLGRYLEFRKECCELLE